MLSIAQIIKKYDILANKSLGQNFLIESEICKQIADAGCIQSKDIIFEVGPGLGSLTRFLLSSPSKNITCIEKDKRFIEILKEEYGEGFDLILCDALKFDFSDFADFKIISNLPYNIGTELLTNWISLTNRPSLMVLMLQKEVVERITAKPKTKNYGRLSVICQAFYECTKLFDVSRGSFFPSPNVCSSVVRLKRREVSYSPKKLQVLTERLFSSRRKILKNALTSLNLNREDLFYKRAEELSVQDFLSLL